MSRDFWALYLVFELKNVSSDIPNLRILRIERIGSNLKKSMLLLSGPNLRVGNLS